MYYVHVLLCICLVRKITSLIYIHYAIHILTLQLNITNASVEIDFICTLKRYIFNGTFQMYILNVRFLFTFVKCPNVKKEIT